MKISELPYKLRRKAMKNRTIWRHMHNRNNHRNVSDNIFSAFSWDLSPEGVGFWGDLSKAKNVDEIDKKYFKSL